MPIAKNSKTKSRLVNKSRRGGIAGVIFISSFAGLAVLVIGSLVFNELRTGLTQARADTLRAQAETIASVLAEDAVIGEPEPLLDESRARSILKRLFREPRARLRLYSKDKRLIADSALIYDEIMVRELPQLGSSMPNFKKVTETMFEYARIMVQGAFGNPREELLNEVTNALSGSIITHERFDENAQRVVSVSVPVQRVKAVVGVLTLESADVSQIITRERQSLVPFIVAAVMANLLSASALAFAIARPLRRLALAADEVSTGQANSLEVSDLLSRPDEIGELTEALRNMTDSMQERIDANESFAADVAHELKNPLAAIRNATEILQGNVTAEQRKKLENNIISALSRIDRLVTDIANASRLDAELARQSRKTISLKAMLESLLKSYQSLGRDKKINVQLNLENEDDGLNIKASDDAINRVFINLLDNAMSFAPENSNIKISARHKGQKIQIMIEDEGVGIPQEALNKIFDRFYTQRPKDQSYFGAHSGLGLAIALQIVESHEGKLWAQNRFDGDKIIGARFLIELLAS